MPTLESQNNLGWKGPLERIWSTWLSKMVTNWNRLLLWRTAKPDVPSGFAPWGRCS